MSTDTETAGPRISSAMNLEQAMDEVRAYLDRNKRLAAMPPDPPNFPAGQLSMQSAFIARLADIATRLGHVEPNSKLGPPGVFFKRVVRKLIGWYSRPAQEFDRTTVETFQQIRSDLLQLQQQIVALNRQVAELQQPPSTSALDLQSDSGNSLLRSLLQLFRGMLASPGVRQALQKENPALLNQVDGLLETVEVELNGQPQVSTGRRAKPSS